MLTNGPESLIEQIATPGGNRPVVHAIYGFTGAGKTTLAELMESRGFGVSLSQDEWMIQLFGVNPPVEQFEDIFTKVWLLLLQTAGRLIRANQSVILDRGFWTRRSRDEIRKFALDNGAEFRLYSLVADYEVLKRRVLKRSREDKVGKHFFIDEFALDLFIPRFEALCADEMSGVIELRTA